MRVSRKLKIDDFNFNETYLWLTYLEEFGDLMMGAYQGVGFLDNETSFRLLFWFVNGKRLNLDFPETFNEKPQWLKLHDGNQLYQVMVYKLIAKEWATNRIGNRYIISTLAIWDNVDGIDLNDLPEQFVLKTNQWQSEQLCMQDRVRFDI